MIGLGLTGDPIVENIPTFEVRGLIKGAQTFSTFEDLGLDASGSLNTMAFDGITDYADGELVLLYLSRRFDEDTGGFVDAPELDGVYRIVTIGHSHEDPRFERVAALVSLFEVEDGRRYGSTFWKNLTLVSEYVPNERPFILEELRFDDDCMRPLPPPPPPDAGSEDDSVSYGGPTGGANLFDPVTLYDWITVDIGGAPPEIHLGAHWNYDYIDSSIRGATGNGIPGSEYQLTITFQIAKESGSGTVQVAHQLNGTPVLDDAVSHVVSTTPVDFEYSVVLDLVDGDDVQPILQFDTLGEGVWMIFPFTFEITPI